ncbi:MAG: DUF2905 domain-containing protein [Candidatus Latescibacteria bacterium]|nr:DUF2905 domain-containing protein [Candidatus Latescibacterota bacterium]
MAPLPKLLITLGIVLILAGLLWHFGGKHLSLGRLPGDIAIERKNFSFYLPLGTCILISAIISLALYLFDQFRK